MPLRPAIPPGGLGASIVAAFLIGSLIIRKRGIYFAMLTIAFGQMFYFIASQWNSLTGGQDGLTGFKRTDFLGLRHPPGESLLLFRVRLLLPHPALRPGVC